MGVNREEEEKEEEKSHAAAAPTLCRFAAQLHCCWRRRGSGLEGKGVGGGGERRCGRGRRRGGEGDARRANVKEVRMPCLVTPHLEVIQGTEGGGP
jgi:hypothetical protein